jgi:hypothetical protein
MIETIFITEQEMCDCAACPGSARMAPRYACGCEEEICPECGCCLLCCDGDHDDDPGLGDDFED